MMALDDFDQPSIGPSEFLAAIFRDVDEGWVHTFDVNRVTGERVTTWRAVDRLDELAAAAVAQTLSCVWFGPALRATATPGKRGGSDECTAITALWLDIDIAGPGHLTPNLPPDLDEAMRIVDQFPMPPSAIVATGGGIQPWWFLDEPTDHDDARALLVRWGATWAEYGRQLGYHVDNVFDLARIMRLPGTVNNKLPGQPRPVTVTDWHPDRRYGLDDVDQWLIDPPAPPESSHTPLDRQIPYIGPERPGDAYNAATVDVGPLWERHGFVYDHADSDGGRHYRAPHHAGERGNTGLTVYADGHSTLYSETFAAQAGMRTKRPYDAFGVLTFLEHRGDWSAASEALAAQGYGTRNVLGIAPYAGPGDTSGEDGEGDESDWAPIDLAEIAAKIRDGSFAPIAPTVLGVDGAMPLFYPGRINQLFGESGGGKTWVGLSAVAEVVRAGGRVLFIDYEDAAGGITERLVLLGLDDDEIALVDYRNPSTGLLLGIPTITTEYALVVVDSTGEAMASGGVNPNADEEVAMWFRLIKILTRLPGLPAVVVLDHVPKATDAPSSYAIGSQRKRAAVTGAAYRVDTIKEPAKGRSGKLKLTVAKDRPGNRAKGTIAAIVDIEAGDAGAVAITLHQSDHQAADAAGEKFRPTVLMERVSRWLELNPRATKNDIVKSVEGKRTVVMTAVDVLVEEGYIVTQPGDRRAVLHVAKTPFRGLDGLAEPVDNSTSGDWFPVVPTGSRVVPGTSEVTGSLVPTPYGGNQGNQSHRKLDFGPSGSLAGQPVDNSPSEPKVLDPFNDEPLEDQ